MSDHDDDRPSLFRDGGDDEGVEPEPAPAKRSWVRRHKALTGLFVIILVLLVSCGGWAVYLNQQIANVPRVHLNLDEHQRPDRPTGKAAESLNILLAGVDNGNGPDISKSLSQGEWNPGSHRSDTIMILHITADRDHAYLISVPRDTWVNVPGYGMHKINAAFSFGGPSLYVRTMEAFTGLRMDHLAIIDWAGFKDLTKALGGIRVYIPRNVYDSANDQTWTKGYHTLAGEKALLYVRQRHGLQHGDFSRIKRQQNFLRATMEKLLSQNTLTNPLKLTDALGAVTSNLVLDEGFSTDEIRGLALSLRGLRANDVTFITIPTNCCKRIDGKSTVQVKRKQTKALFGAVAVDNIDAYLEKYQVKSDLLGQAQSVG